VSYCSNFEIGCDLELLELLTSYLRVCSCMACEVTLLALHPGGLLVSTALIFVNFTGSLPFICMCCLFDSRTRL
jgi:hypothetical protein